MSHVTLIAADKPLPLYDCREFREGIVTVPGYEPVAVGFLCSFRVSIHEYYRDGVDGLGFDLKPFRYELDLHLCQTDLEHLLTYLNENLSSGEEVELWSLWVGFGGSSRPQRYRGRLGDFDLDALEMLTETQYEPDAEGEFPNGLISQTCLTVVV